jgi:hypothetical protein
MHKRSPSSAPPVRRRERYHMSASAAVDENGNSADSPQRVQGWAWQRQGHKHAPWASVCTLVSSTLVALASVQSIRALAKSGRVCLGAEDWIGALGVWPSRRVSQLYPQHTTKHYTKDVLLSRGRWWCQRR